MESISEKNGLELIGENDLNILSIGISTSGSAEIKMAKKNPSSKIIATTIDEKGIVNIFSDTVSEYIDIEYSLKDDKGNVIKHGFDILVYGNIPNGAGLSSSASLELLMSVILNDTFNLNSITSIFNIR